MASRWRLLGAHRAAAGRSAAAAASTTPEKPVATRTATAASRAPAARHRARAAADRAQASCYATAASARAPLRFRPAARGRSGGGSLSIGRYRAQEILVRAPACASAVLTGHTYRLSLRYTSTTRAIGLAVLTFADGSWHASVARAALAPSKRLRSASTLVGPIAASVTRVALGVLLKGRGAVEVTAFAAVDASAHTPAPGGGVAGYDTSAPATVEPLGTASVTQPAGGSTPGEGKSKEPAEEEPVKEESGKEEPAKEKPIKEEPVKEEPLKEPSQCDQLAKEEPPSELSLPEAPSNEPLSVTGRWSVREGVDQARTVHAVLLQNGKVLLMAGSGNSRMEFDAGCFRSYVYDPVTNTSREILTPKDLFCSGHVQLANGNVLIVGGTRG
ncbi:MAG TPA: hypothetical protein VKV16_10165, partial [Solirubrobacteraceae bacterium]|nr:hypothetical protein [Solirubrobacteraceae bacterium]